MSTYVCSYVSFIGVRGCLCSHLLGSSCDRVDLFTWYVTLDRRNVLVTVGYVADIIRLSTSKIIDVC